jgi:uncharacterized repeat protein (TIGR01451 family)
MSVQSSCVNRVNNSKRVLSGIYKTFFVAIILVLICSIGASSQNFKIVKSGPVVSNPGETITYIISVRNAGKPVSDAVITDYLPESNLYTYLSSKPAGLYNAESNTIKWDKTNNPDLESFANSEIYIAVTIKTGTNDSGEYKVPYLLTKLKSHTTIESEHLNILINGNEINTDVPKAGGAVLPVE